MSEVLWEQKVTLKCEECTGYFEVKASIAEVMLTTVVLSFVIFTAVYGICEMMLKIVRKIKS